MSCVNHPQAEHVTTCITCGSSICDSCRVLVKYESYCKKCIAKKVGDTLEPRHSPVLATILSFIIGGGGQIYNGQIGKGILILFTSWLVIPWLYGIFDAYSTAKKIRDGLIPAPKSSMGCAIALVGGVIVIMFTTAIIGILAAIAIPNFLKAREAAITRLKERAALPITPSIPAPSPTQIPKIEKAKEPEVRLPEKEKAPLPKTDKYAKVYLKNGRTLEGKITKQTEDYIIVKINGGTFTMKWENIEKIVWRK